MSATRRGSWSVLAALAFGAPCRAQSSPARDIVARAIDALGGRVALARHQTRYARGTVEVLGGYIGPYESWSKAPNKLRTRWDIGVIRHNLGFDGRAGWEKALTVRELPALDLERVRRRAVYQGLLWQLDSRTPVALGPNPPGDTLAVVFTPPGGLQESIYFDRASHLPVKEVRQTRYEEGVVDLVVTYGDYRKVGDVTLPFAIDERLLELPLSIRIQDYKLDLPMPDSLFVNPQAGHAREPYAVSLATIPEHIYKESDGGEPSDWRRFWGIPFTPTESWLVNVLVREKYGRQVTPLGATIDLFAGAKKVRSETFSPEALAAFRKYPVARFHPQDETFHIRHHFTEGSGLGVDRVLYTLQYQTAPGQRGTATLAIPVTRYRTKTNLIAPIRGNLLAVTGHEFYELGHKYEWSQQFSYDLVALGPNLEFKRAAGDSLAAYYTFGHELVAPGDGKVVYSRNDVPDLMPPKQYLKLKDPQWAIGGNSVIIDHGNGEISCLFHMKQGSVRVKTGDVVKQGQVIGQIGSSGSPGHPHTHYQLQAGPEVFGADALPIQFTNVERVGWVAGRQQLPTPIRGVYLFAK